MRANRSSLTRIHHPAVGRPARGRAAVLVLAAIVWLFPAAARAQVQVTAVARPNAEPAWSKGLQPISAESYYHAIECGKQGGDDPPCVFWDTGLCKNDDFTLAWYSAYKEVAYQVWTAVRKKQPAPQPSYQSAQRTRVTIGVTRAPGSKNTLTGFVVKRGGKPVSSVSRSVATGQFTYDYPAWAPTSRVTIEMVGKTRTVSCVIPAAVLAQLR